MKTLIIGENKLAFRRIVDIISKQKIGPPTNHRDKVNLNAPMRNLFQGLKSQGVMKLRSV